MVAKHLGMAITEPQRRRWVNLIQDAADEAGLPDDPEFRAAFLGYIEWGTRLARQNRSPARTSPWRRRCRTGAGGGAAVAADRHRRPGARIGAGVTGAVQEKAAGSPAAAFSRF